MSDETQITPKQQNDILNLIKTMKGEMISEKQINGILRSKPVRSMSQREASRALTDLRAFLARCRGQL